MLGWGFSRRYIQDFIIIIDNVDRWRMGYRLVYDQLDLDLHNVPPQ